MQSGDGPAGLLPEFGADSANLIDDWVVFFVFGAAHRPGSENKVMGVVMIGLDSPNRRLITVT